MNTERIVTSVRKVNLNNLEDKNINKERPLYEVNAIIDGIKKKFNAYADTESFLEILDDLEKYIGSCYEKIDDDALKYTEDNRWKYNFIGLPLYIVGVLGAAISGRLPEFVNFLSFVSGVAITAVTGYFANGKIYYSQELKEKRYELEQKRENLEILKKNSKIWNKKREMREYRAYEEDLREKVMSSELARKQKERNIKELNAEIKRRNLPPNSNTRNLNTGRTSNFKNDIPDYLKRNNRINNLNKEYDVLEQTGRKR